MDDERRRRRPAADAKWHKLWDALAARTGEQKITTVGEVKTRMGACRDTSR